MSGTPAYQPASGTPSLTAGAKVAHFDRVEWHIITDAATASAALQNGEIDWYEQPPPEIQQLFRRNRAITVEAIDRLPNPAVLRFNHLHPPFNDKKMRQALLPAISQTDYMTAIVGPDPALYSDTMGTFTPGTPLANDAGMAALTGPRSIDRAKALLKEAGYTNQPIRLIGPTDILAPAAMTQVAGDMFRKLEREPRLRADGLGQRGAAPGEPGAAGEGRLERLPHRLRLLRIRRPLRQFPAARQWCRRLVRLADDPAAGGAARRLVRRAGPRDQKKLAREIQLTMLDEVPYIPVGAYTSMTSFRRNLTGRVPGFALFWNIKRG